MNYIIKEFDFMIDISIYYLLYYQSNMIYLC